jgi:hypothetical protein
MELPLFSYESVSVATGQFSDKLGEGGFGPVYKVIYVQKIILTFSEKKNSLNELSELLLVHLIGQIT